MGPLPRDLFWSFRIFWQKNGTRFINFMSQRYIEKLNKTEVFFTAVLGKHHNLGKCLVIFLSAIDLLPFWRHTSRFNVCDTRGLMNRTLNLKNDTLNTNLFIFGFKPPPGFGKLSSRSVYLPGCVCPPDSRWLLVLLKADSFPFYSYNIFSSLLPFVL